MGFVSSLNAVSLENKTKKNKICLLLIFFLLILRNMDSEGVKKIEMKTSQFSRLVTVRVEEKNRNKTAKVGIVS